MYNFYSDIYNYQLNNIIYDNKRDNDGCDDDNSRTDDAEDCLGEYSSD